MTGLPAARQIDMALHGGPITQGSRTVHIGTSGGVACSTCPGGVAKGNPVNPMLGAKVQAGEVDFSLPGPLPFAISRDYSSYQTDTPAPVGLLGPGWWLPMEVSLLQTDELLTVNDSTGRSIRFTPLARGESAYSRSENLWIVRGGLERLDVEPQLPVSRLNIAWMGLHKSDRCNPALFFVTNDPLGPWWVLGTTTRAGDVTGQRLQLLGLNDRFGHSQRLQRDADGRVVAVQDGAGRHYSLELKRFAGLANEGSSGWGADSGVRLTAVYLTQDPLHPDLPKQPLVRYEYSPQGELIAVFGRDASQSRTFQYHPQMVGRMTAHAHAGRPPVRYIYSPAGKVIEQLRQGALSYRFDYADDSTTVTDSLGRVSAYHFKGQGGLRRVVQRQEANGSTTQSRFDSSGRLLASIDALGRETHYEREVATGALLAITRPDGLQSRFNYTAQGQIERSTRPGGTSDIHTYDAMGRLASFTDALGHVTRYHYTDVRSEQPDSIEDAKGGKKQFVWNKVGQLIRHTDCSGSVTRYRYDRWGQAVEMTGEEGTHTRTEYDERGRAIATTDALNQTTGYAYNNAGDLLRITAPDGNSVQFERDVQGRAKAYHYGGYSLQFDYDAAGRMVQLTNENGAHTRFEYDVMDLLTKQVNIDDRIQQYRFNAAGELVQSNDQGIISHYNYDQGGRLTNRQVGEETQGQGVSEHFEYGADGLLRKAWHTAALGGTTVATEFERDALEQVTREIQSISGPDHSEVWRYSVDRRFDELGSVSHTTYTGLPTITWQTYGSGHLLGVLLDGRSVVDFERDRLHRETKRQFGQTQSTRTYDRLSRLSQMHTQSHTHDPMVDDAAAFERTHHYDAANQLIRIESTEGPHAYRYDKARRLIGAVQPGSPDQRYRFDPAGNRLFKKNVEAGSVVEWAETVRQNLEDIAFNVLGDSKLPTEHQMEPKWKQDRVRDDGDFRYEYDAWGNLVRKYKPEGNECHSYVYDPRHRLIQYGLESDTEVRSATYHYDVFGRRVCKQVRVGVKNGRLSDALETSYFGWDGDRLVLTEKDARQIHTIYEPGSFVPLIRAEGSSAGADSPSPQSHATPIQGQTRIDRLDTRTTPSEKRLHLYQCDHAGTPLKLYTREAGVDWSVDLDVWGKALHTDAFTPTQAIRFQGQHVDAESGLHYNRHRYYDPTLSRYTSQNPIGLLGGVHFFAYGLNAPTLYTDPTGLKGQGTPGFATQGAAGNAAIGAINDPSLQEGMEYGGWIGQRPNGRYYFAEPRKGAKDPVPHKLSACGNDSQWTGLDSYLRTPARDIKHIDARDGSTRASQ